MHVLYANNPGQRVLLITHSNQALNDLFSKLLQRDVPARYLLRLVCPPPPHTHAHRRVNLRTPECRGVSAWLTRGNISDLQ